MKKQNKTKNSISRQLVDRRRACENEQHFTYDWSKKHGHLYQKYLWRQNHNDKPVKVSRIFSRPGSVKSWVPNFEIKTVNFSLRQELGVIEKIHKENTNKIKIKR